MSGKSRFEIARLKGSSTPETVPSFGVSYVANFSRSARPCSRSDCHDSLLEYLSDARRVPPW